MVNGILNQGERIKYIRKELNINQEELGGERFSKNYISMFENNKRQINPVNAAFLAKRINDIAKEKNLDMDITSSYFLKTDIDLAKENCDKMLNEVKSNIGLSDENIYILLKDVVILALEYNLLKQYGNAIFLMGLNSFRKKLYYCSLNQFMEALDTYYKLGNIQAIIDTYKYMGIVAYKNRNIHSALSYFNMAENLLKKEHDYLLIDEIEYYREKCYKKLRND